MNIFRRQETKPGRMRKPMTWKCIYCSMPGPYGCEISGCAATMCFRHRTRKAGGNLCRAHQNAVLSQDDALPTEKNFPDAGDAVPHETHKPE